MTALGGLIWRLLPDVRAGERSRFLFFAGLLGMISVAQTMGLAGAEALFLSQIGVERLAPTFIAAAAFTVLGSMLYALRVGSARNDTLYAQMLLGTGALLLAATLGAVSGQLWIYYVLFCSWYLAQAVFFNHFWTFSGDFFDNLSSKRLVPLFTVGSSVGGVAGGVLAAGVASWGGPSSLIAAWGLGLVAAAAMLWLWRRELRSWGPLELEEADETSVESLRGAQRFLRTSPLGQWLTVSALGMVLAFFLAQYLYSAVFTARFPDPGRLAFFFSVYFAITNLVEIVFELRVTPWLIRRIGVPGANLIHPVLMLLSFGGLAWRYGLGAGIGARVARELMDNALAAPIRSLVQNAMPTRFRGRMRAFLEGIVVYAGMASAGVVLLALGDPGPRWLCAVGSAASLAYLYANWRARHAYLDTLVGQLHAGSLDLEEVETLGTWEASRLATLWEDALREEARRPSPSLLQLIPALAGHGIVDPLVRAASHPHPAVRRASVNALATMTDTSVAGPLALALDDPDPSVRLAALRGLSRSAAHRSFLETRLDELLDDPDPRVRAEAALRAGPGRWEILAKMIASPRVEEATAALGLAPPVLLEAVMERTRSDDPRVRAAALECAARIAQEPPLPVAETVALLSDPDPGIRRAAVLLAANLDDPSAIAALAARLADPAVEVSRSAETVLGDLEGPGIAAAEPYLQSETERCVEASARVLWASGLPDARQQLLFELRRHVHDLWWHLLGYHRLPRRHQLGNRFLRAAFRDAMARSHRLAFRMLELLEDPAVVHRIERELRAGGTRARGNALEVLSHLGDRESARLLVLAHEDAPLEERGHIAEEVVQPPRELDELVEAARNSPHRWIRMGVSAWQPRPGEDHPEEETMQQLLALKQVDLFSNLSFEQLDAVHGATEEAEYVAGEVIFREGDRGDALYLLIEGDVAIIKSEGTPEELRLRTISAVTYFGEMASLAGERRTATARALGHCRMLRLGGSALRELVLQMPEISFEIFRVLTSRIREAEGRLASDH